MPSITLQCYRRAGERADRTVLGYIMAVHHDEEGYRTRVSHGGVRTILCPPWALSLRRKKGEQQFCIDAGVGTV